MATTFINGAPVCSVHGLSNGIPVLLDPIPHVRTASIGLWIRTGSAFEAAEQAGVSHFLEHLFFKGTSSRSARALMEEIEGRGGHLNAYTSRECICIYAHTLDVHAASAIRVLADILKDSQLCDFEKERNVVLEEIASVDDVPEDYVHDVFVQMLWPDQAIGRPVSGLAGTVRGLKQEDVEAYYGQQRHPERLLVSIAGNIDAADLLDRLEAEFGGLRAGEGPASYPRPRYGAGQCSLERDIAQSHVCFGFPSLAATDERRYGAEMLANVLGGGSTSRLFERIREEEGLAYSVYSFRSAYREAGFLGVYAAVAPENLEVALELAWKEIRKLREEPLSEEELSLNREQLKGGVLMALESTHSRMSRMARSMLCHGRVIGLDEVIEGLERLTVQELHSLAQSTFEDDRCVMAIVGPGCEDVPEEGDPV